MANTTIQLSIPGSSKYVNLTLDLVQLSNDKHLIIDQVGEIGIVHLIDAMQDALTDTFNLPESTVFP